MSLSHIFLNKLQTYLKFKYCFLQVIPGRFPKYSFKCAIGISSLLILCRRLTTPWSGRSVMFIKGRCLFQDKGNCLHEFFITAACPKTSISKLLKQILLCQNLYQCRQLGKITFWAGRCVSNSFKNSFSGTLKTPPKSKISWMFQ